MTGILTELKDQFKDSNEAYVYLASRRELSNVYIYNKENKLYEDYQYINALLNNFIIENDVNLLHKKLIIGKKDTGAMEKTISVISRVYDDLFLDREDVVILLSNMITMNIKKETIGRTWLDVENYINKNSVVTFKMDNTEIIKEIENYLNDNNMNGVVFKSTQGLERTFKMFKNAVDELGDVTNIPKNKLLGSSTVSVGELNYKDCSAFYSPSDDLMCFKHDSFNGDFGHEWMHSTDFKIGSIFNRFIASYCDIELTNKLVSFFYGFNEKNTDWDVLKSVMPTDIPNRYIGFIENEMDLYKDIVSGKETPGNMFVYYAKKADLYDETVTEGYTSSKAELLARSFEGYIKTIANNSALITSSDNSFLYPSGLEKDVYKEQWAKVIVEMANFLGMKDELSINNGLVKDKLKSARGVEKKGKLPIY